MTIQKDWESEVRRVFDKIKSHKKEYITKIADKEIIVLPNVFSPHYFTDSEWFVVTIPKIIGKKSLLEIGTGTGIVALFAALNGSKVVATDINPTAVKNAELNFKKYNVNVKVLLGDMYKPLNINEKFDFIFWNHPFNKGIDPNEEILLKAGFDYQYNSLINYIKGAKGHLTERGKLLLGTGNFALLSEIKTLAKEMNYDMILLEMVKIPLAADSSIDNDYRIYELRKKLG